MKDTRKRDPERGKRYYASHRQQVLNRQQDKVLRDKYGISLEEKLLMIEEQRGLCAVCWKPLNGTRSHVDHDHKTNKVRGITCGNCNRGMGYLMDDPAIAEAAAVYLAGDPR